jgi:hypothetical protein
MRPHEFRRLVELLRSEFSATKKAIQEGSASAYEAKEAESIKWREIPGITAALIDANQNNASTYAESQKAHREQEH